MQYMEVDSDVAVADTAEDGEAIMIPVRDSEELVRVNLDELPKDADEIIDILKAEFAPLDIWLKFALEYYKRGMVENFKTILDEGADEALDHQPAYSNETAKKQRIAILNVLAAYYVKQATKSKDAQKEEFFNLATANYNKADKIDIHEEMTWVGKGVLLLYKGSNERAQKYFETVLEANPENTPALLGKACIAYNRGAYEEALKFYCTALRTNPSCPANVRLGLGYCFYRLGRLELAQRAFERVLKLEPDNAQALAGLGILELNSKKADSVHKAMTLLKKAYDVDPSNPLVLNHLSNHFFYKKDYTTALTLAQTAHNNTQVREIRAESFYYFGRAYHAQKQYDQAFKSYANAVELWPDHVLAQFGLGQLHVQRGDYEKAISCFDAVLKKHPDNYETLKILGSLYAATGKKERAIHNFRRITETHPRDAEVWIELAALIEKRNFKEAHDAYQKAIHLMEAKGEAISPELWNNVGVLCQKLGDLNGAENAYRKVLELTGATETQFKAQNITTLYNLALLYEAQHQHDKATILYKAILKEHPNYIDCYLRLGSMARDKGHIYEASEWFKETFMIHPNDASAWSLLGNLHLAKDEWLPAQKKFEYVLAQPENRDDPYALLSLANIYYSAKFDKKDKAERYLSHSMKYYWQVMVKQPNNIYAANGLGIILAERGQLDQAKEFFIKVREATATMPDVWINLAHIYLVQGQYVNAIKMYQNCLKKFYDGQNPELLLFLAKACYEYGRMEDCKKALVKAIHMTPNNNVLWYDLALSQEGYAKSVIKRPKPSCKELELAAKELEQCIRTFKHLGGLSAKASRLKINTARATKHAEQCEKLLERAKGLLQQAEREEQENRARREEVLRKQQEEQEKMQAEIKRRAEEAEEERIRLEQMALEAKQRLEELKGKWEIDEKKEDVVAAGKGKKRKQAQYEAGSEYSDSELEGNEVGSESQGDGATPKKRSQRSGKKGKKAKSRGKKGKKGRKKRGRSTAEEEKADEEVGSTPAEVEEGSEAWKEMRDRRAAGMAELVRKRKMQLEEERFQGSDTEKRKKHKHKEKKKAKKRRREELPHEAEAKEEGAVSPEGETRRRLKKKAEAAADLGADLLSDEGGEEEEEGENGNKVDGLSAFEERADEADKEEASLFSEEEEDEHSGPEEAAEQH